MNRHGIHAIWNTLTNLAAGRIGSYEYTRQPLSEWDVEEDEYFLLSNVNIVDVRAGRTRGERGVLIRNGRIEELVLPQDLAPLRSNFPIKMEMDGDQQYLIPGLSDIHCHVALVSEYGANLKAFSYWDAQRLKNCEEALKRGCTFIRDCGGAPEQLGYIMEEIAAHRLLGPKIMASMGAISPKGGMWDVGPIVNWFAQLMFGGKVLRFPSTNQEIVDAMTELDAAGGAFFKTYFEERPIWGGKEATMFNMFTPEQARLIRQTADKYGKHVASHTMFLKGSRLAVEAGMDTIDHCPVDGPYSLEDARLMTTKGIASVPTLSLGCLLAMNCGSQGYPHDSEVEFFTSLRRGNARQHARQVAITQLRDSYEGFFDWLDEDIEDRKMPHVGPVYPERVHGFARYAPESIRNLQEAEVRVGIGTDGGTGITFCGLLDNEVEALTRYGYSKADVLRMATLGNMEILGLDDDMGSLDVGKLADMVLLKEHPLDDLGAYKAVSRVFKDGRLVHKA